MDRVPRQLNPSRQEALRALSRQVMAQLGMTWGTTLSLASNQAILNLLIPVMSAGATDGSRLRNAGTDATFDMALCA